jgi:hypothetical protein
VPREGFCGQALSLTSRHLENFGFGGARQQARRGRMSPIDINLTFEESSLWGDAQGAHYQE